VNVVQQHPNAAASTGAGAAAILLVWIASLFGLEVPAEVGAAVATLLSGVVLLLPGPKTREG
jgi:hypothetical protein